MKAKLSSFALILSIFNKKNGTSIENLNPLSEYYFYIKDYRNSVHFRA
ncbi:hypothetical protein [Borreliella carolinensis]